jgi:hypothetical protein
MRRGKLVEKLTTKIFFRADRQDRAADRAADAIFVLRFA